MCGLRSHKGLAWPLSCRTAPLMQIAQHPVLSKRHHGAAWPGSRSSGRCGLARPVVPGGVSLLAVLLSTCSIVVTDAASAAIITATAKSTTAVRWLFRLSLMREPPLKANIERLGWFPPRSLLRGLQLSAIWAKWEQLRPETGRLPNEYGIRDSTPPSSKANSFAGVTEDPAHCGVSRGASPRLARAPAQRVEHRPRAEFHRRQIRQLGQAAS